MADIMETTPEMDLDIELINGLDNHDDRHPTPVNEQPLPVDVPKKEEHGSGLSGYPESLRPCLDFRTHFQTNYLRYSFSPHSPHPLVSH
ncbi:hypothetical protein TNCV_2917511 [Trichonephila clavipes]|nr:hypothetical protein TNCV_2917511 [Trichonephila clavipes]